MSGEPYGVHRGDHFQDGGQNGQRHAQFGNVPETGCECGSSVRDLYACGCAWLAQFRSSFGPLELVERCWMYPPFRRCRSICLATGVERGQGLFRVRQKRRPAEIDQTHPAVVLITTMRSATTPGGLIVTTGRACPPPTFHVRPVMITIWLPLAASSGMGAILIKKAARREGQAGRSGRCGKLPAVRRTLWAWLFT
jgi:hypothetical protein